MSGTRERAGPQVGPAALKDLYERKARALHRRPELARWAGQTRVRLTEAGLACQADAPGSPVTIDLPASDGGAGRGPGPADLLRASLGACLAIDYRVWAARLDVPLGAIEVDVVAESDARGALLPGTDIAPGLRRLVVTVTVHSPAPPADVAQVIGVANARCLVLASLSPAIERFHLLSVVPSGGG